MIKIQNIYYMLAYAFQVLNEDSYKKIAAEEFDNAENLLAAILAKGIANQIKRGLGREYISCTGSLSSPRGKINIASSITSQLNKRQLVCDYDEFSENAYMNQVLKCSAICLIRSDTVRTVQKSALKKVLLYFHNVDELKPHKIRWENIRYHRNNATYKMLMHICYFVINSLLPTTTKGEKGFSGFKDEHLHRLFERFVLEFYRKHYPEYKASAAQIDWLIDDGLIEMLPVMKSDITLEHNGKTLIIDTKYYGKTLQSNSLYNIRTVHSRNLYQIFAYVKNKDINRSGSVSGLLLYAKTDEEITPNNTYSMSGNKISVKTLDLDKNFEEIKCRLDEIVSEWL